MGLCRQLNSSQILACEIVRSCLSVIRELNDLRHTNGTSVVYSGNVGRPRFNIPLSQLQFFLEHMFSVPQIADILGVSIRTVR
jgi:hypothetical protein